MKTSRRLKRMSRKKGIITRVNLTSLMDVFTILVFFLLVNSGSPETLKAPKQVQLPESNVETKPRETVLIFVGTAFVITRDVFLAVRAIPREQITKALTLGASQLAVVYRVVLPQVFPRLLDTVRLTLGAGWLFLIAAEAIASTNGLGYRIFLVRRYLAMDVIIPYVLWITFLGFLLDFGLRRLVARRFAWYVATRG